MPRSHASQNSLTRSTAGHHNTGNLSELDSLLQDLSSAQYGAHLEKRGGGGAYSNDIGSPSQPHHVLSDSIKRPSVDSLLDELSNAHSVGPIYAVPNGYVFLINFLTKKTNFDYLILVMLVHQSRAASMLQLPSEKRKLKR